MKGYVEKVFTNKFGYHSLLVDGTWYNVGKDDASQFENQTVEFDVEQTKGKNGKTYYNGTNVKIVKAAGKSSGGGGGGGNSYDNRQSSIVLQSSYKTATDIINMAIAVDALTFKGSKAAKLDQLLIYVDEVALRLYNNCLDPTDFLANAGVGEDAEEDPEAPPEDDDFNNAEA